MNNKAVSGFTLIELLIVIAIIGILAAVLVPNLVQARTRSHESATQSYIYQVVVGVEANRNVLNQRLPLADIECKEFASLVNEPSSVSKCKYEPNHVANTYTVTAESISGEIFSFNGTSIIAAENY